MDGYRHQLVQTGEEVGVVAGSRRHLVEAPFAALFDRELYQLVARPNPVQYWHSREHEPRADAASAVNH
jgi:hypothetical protein